MIFDRTQNDVDTAIVLRREKVQTFQELTEAEIEILEKGLLTIKTLNRIEDKQEELKNILKEIGYFNINTNNTSWGYLDIFTQKDFDRILENLSSLVDGFFVYKNTPKIPEKNYRKYQVINDVEKILQDIDVMINDVKSHYRECGAFESGE